MHGSNQQGAPKHESLRTPMLLRTAMVTLSMFLCLDLIETWESRKSEALGYVGFAIWILALCISKFLSREELPERPVLTSVALILSVLGEIVSVNAIQHVGLVFLIVSLAGPKGKVTFGIITGMLWLPVVGYCERYCFGQSMIAIRLGIIVLAVFSLAKNHTLVRIARPPRTSDALLGVVLIGWLALPSSVFSDEFTYSPVQSPARPFGLDIIDRVALEGSDTASADFMNNRLESFQNLVNENLSERREASLDGNSSLIALDPTRMTLSEQTTVRAYFVGEGAGYHNTLGFNADGLGVDSGNPFLVFPDASSPRSYLSSGRKKRTVSEPLMPGDFVQLGEVGAGTLLDFFLIANGARGGTNVYGAPAERNPDGLDHIVAFAQVENPYVLIGFEDLYGGGDKDYNDLVMAVYFGEGNTSTFIDSARWDSALPAPEPSSLIIMVIAVGYFVLRRHRHD